MSTYVISGLALCRDAGIQIPEHTLEYAGYFLINQLNKWKLVEDDLLRNKEKLSTRCAVLYAYLLLKTDPEERMELDTIVKAIIEERERLSDYSLALLALSIDRMPGFNSAKPVLLAELVKRAIVDAPLKTAYWGEKQYRYWYDSSHETTCYCLMALLKLDPSNDLIHKTVQWVINNKVGNRWYSTKDTAYACYAISNYLQFAKELDTNQTYTILINGKQVQKESITKKNLFSKKRIFELKGDELKSGKHQIEIRKTGKGNLYWNITTSYYSAEKSIEPSKGTMTIVRNYYKLTPKNIKHNLLLDDKLLNKKDGPNEWIDTQYERTLIKDDTIIQSGDLIEVDLSVRAPSGAEYILIEDPKPAGCEPVRIQSGQDSELGWDGHIEFRDEKVAMFIGKLWNGESQYNYRLRAETPGVFQVMPARIEAMYTPDMKANSSNHVIRIVDGE